MTVSLSAHYQPSSDPPPAFQSGAYIFMLDVQISKWLSRKDYGSLSSGWVDALAVEMPQSKIRLYVAPMFA